MRLTMKERDAVVATTAARYRKAKRKEKKRILDEIVKVTGYTRSYATYVLRNHGRKVYLKKGVVVVGDARQKPSRTRTNYYDEKVIKILTLIWQVMDYIWGKRLAPILPEIVERLEKHGEIRPDAQTREKLLEVSAATIDRLLKTERSKYQLRARSHTKPGTLLKQQIRIRTFSEWDEKVAGFMEIDLVGHEGGQAGGEFLFTLCMTDIKSGWTETAAIKNKAQIWTLEALQNVRKSLPFELLGIDSDNGSEFINGHLISYCEKEKITFTRARPYRKNDNCFVEQKNYSVVRRAVGYQRYDTPKQQEMLNELYSCLRIYTNYFQPTMKLKEKHRDGSKVKKKYEIAQTPYQRLMKMKEIPARKKRELKKEYEQHNPAELKRKIARIQRQLLKSSEAAPKRVERTTLPRNKDKANKPAQRATRGR
jgi:hypothetical protein